MASMYYSDRAAAIICYDITNSHSFMKAKDWILQLKIHSCKIYLCATKKDLCDKIEASDSPLNNIQKYAEDIQAKFFATSSRTGENISKNKYFKIYCCKMCIYIYMYIYLCLSPFYTQMSCFIQL